MTKMMTGKKKGSWNIYKIQEAKADWRKFWNLVKELLGKTKKKDEEVYIYEGDGSKKEADKVWDEYLKDGKKKLIRRHQG